VLLVNKEAGTKWSPLGSNGPTVTLKKEQDIGSTGDLGPQALGACGTAVAKATVKGPNEGSNRLKQKQ
jgi:hypothetical protein